MHDLKERLEALADEGTVRGADAVFAAARRAVDDVPALGEVLVPQRRIRRHVLVAFALVVVLALVVSSVVFLGGSTDPASNLVPVVPDENPLRDLFVSTDAPPDAPTTFLVPGYLPDGMRLLRAAGGYQPGVSSASGGSPETDRSQVWVRIDPTTDRPVERFFISWGPGATAWDDLPIDLGVAPTDDPIQGFRPDAVPVTVRGRPGLYQAGMHAVAWEEPAGRMVSVGGESLSRDELVAIAEGLRARPDGGYTATRAPEGYLQVSESDGQSSDGTNAREFVYRDTDGRGFKVDVVDDPGTPPGNNLSATRDPEAKPRVIELRGRHAVATTQLYSGGGGLDQQTLFLRKADTFFQWLEPNHVMVTLTGLGLSEPELVAIAEGLHIVDATGWDSLLVQAPGRVGAPSVPRPAEPPTFVGDRAAVADAFHAWFDARNRGDADAAAAAIEDGERLRPTFAAARQGSSYLGTLSARVDEVRLVGADRALVTFSILDNGAPKLPDQLGGAVRADGRWRVSRATYCAIVELVGVKCPAP